MIKPYFSGLQGARVLIFGMQPPPFGGISIHISRKVAALQKLGNCVLVFDVCKEYAQRSKLGYVWHIVRTFFPFRPQHVYYHMLLVRKNPIELFLLGLLSALFGARVTVVEHNYRAIYPRSVWYARSLSFVIHLFVHQQVMIGPLTLQAYQDKKMFTLPDVMVTGAFIEPDFSQEAAIIAAYPPELHSFIAQKRCVLLVNASSFTLHQGIDVYGIDLCIRLLRDLPSDVGMVIAVGTVTNRHYHDEIMAQLAVFKEQVFVLFNCQAELWPLMRHTDIFLRPMRYDTDGISVHEALMVDTPVIASDSALRPAASILFKDGDYNDFFAKVSAKIAAFDVQPNIKVVNVDKNYRTSDQNVLG